MDTLFLLRNVLSHNFTFLSFYYFSSDVPQESSVDLLPNKTRRTNEINADRDVAIGLTSKGVFLMIS